VEPLLHDGSPRDLKYALESQEVVIKVAPFEEIGFRLQEMGLDPARDIAAVILTHFHHDHTGGLGHFPHTRIIAPRESWNVSRGFQGKMAGCLPQRWPIWLKPELVDIDGPAVGPFPHSHPITKDGRIFLVATPGHSKGHVSVVVRGEGVSYFLAGDAAYDEACLARLMLGGHSSQSCPLLEIPPVVQGIHR